MAQQPARKAFPIVLPDNDMFDNPTTWQGKIPKASDTTLPVAYLPEFLMGLGVDYYQRPSSPYTITIHFQGTNAPGPNKPMLVPRIVIGGPPDLFTSLTGDDLDWANKMGIVHIDNIPFPQARFIGDPDGEPSMLNGLPVVNLSEFDVSASPWTPLDPTHYTGGQLYLFFGEFNGDGIYYVENDTPNTYNYTAQEGTGAQCSPYGFSPGTLTEAASLPTDPLFASFPLNAGVISDDIAFLQEALKSLDKFHVAYWNQRNPVNITVVPQVTCFDGLANQLVDDPFDDEVVVGTDVAIVNAKHAADASVIAQMGDVATYFGSEPDYLAEVKAFFV